MSKPRCQMCGAEMAVVQVNSKMKRAECSCGHQEAIIKPKWSDLELEREANDALKEEKRKRSRYDITNAEHVSNEEGQD